MGQRPECSNKPHSVYEYHLSTHVTRAPFCEFHFEARNLLWPPTLPFNMIPNLIVTLPQPMPYVARKQKPVCLDALFCTGHRDALHATHTQQSSIVVVSGYEMQMLEFRFIEQYTTVVYCSASVSSSTCINACNDEPLQHLL